MVIYLQSSVFYNILVPIIAWDMDSIGLDWTTLIYVNQSITCLMNQHDSFHWLLTTFTSHTEVAGPMIWNTYPHYIHKVRNAFNVQGSLLLQCCLCYTDVICRWHVYWTENYTHKSCVKGPFRCTVKQSFFVWQTT